MRKHVPFALVAASLMTPFHKVHPQDNDPTGCTPCRDYQLGHLDGLYVT